MTYTQQCKCACTFEQIRDLGHLGTNVTLPSGESLRRCLIGVAITDPRHARKAGAAASAGPVSDKALPPASSIGWERLAVANANPDPRLATAQAAGALGGIPRINARIYAEVAKVAYIAVTRAAIRLGDFWSEGGDEVVEPDGLDALALVASVRLEGVRLSLSLARAHASSFSSARASSSAPSTPCPPRAGTDPVTVNQQSPSEPPWR